jgi:hypothetical protein
MWNFKSFQVYRGNINVEEIKCCLSRRTKLRKSLETLWRETISEWFHGHFIGVTDILAQR